jgi:hypothetical protein
MRDPERRNGFRVSGLSSPRREAEGLSGLLLLLLCLPRGELLHRLRVAILQCCEQLRRHEELPAHTYDGGDRFELLHGLLLLSLRLSFLVHIPRLQLVLLSSLRDRLVRQFIREGVLLAVDVLHVAPLETTGQLQRLGVQRL